MNDPFKLDAQTIRRTAPDEILGLREGEVFVFGTNGQGFHGAGSAGVAFRGSALNTWRQDPAFLKAMTAPPGSPDRIGNWAVYGIAKGHMVGRLGQSYGILTITRPGAKRSIPLHEIQKQLLGLWAYADAHPDLTFLLTKIGCSLAGYSEDEIKASLYALDLALFVNAKVLLPEEW